MCPHENGVEELSILETAGREDAVVKEEILIEQADAIVLRSDRARHD